MIRCLACSKASQEVLRAAERLALENLLTSLPRPVFGYLESVKVDCFLPS